MLKFVIARYPLISTPLYWLNVAACGLIQSDAVAYSFLAVMTVIYVVGLVAWWRSDRDDRLTPPEIGDSHDFALRG